MVRPLWFERKFDFSFPVELYPEIIERLRGTPARIEERLRDVPPALLTRRDGGKWSIQENIGHLLDLDELFVGRFDDYERGMERLRAADLLNQKTHQAQHNSRPAEEILRQLENKQVGSPIGESLKKVAAPKMQLSIFDAHTETFQRIRKMLETTDINRLTPVEALLKLQEVQNELK